MKRGKICVFLSKGKEVERMENKQKEIVNERVATDLKTSDFYYELPQELIAQHPLERRDSSRLMVIDRKKGDIEHKHCLHSTIYNI